MTDAKRLLAEATPLPWTYRAVADAYLYGDGDFPPSPVNLDLAVYAVNHLPDYLAAVEAARLREQAEEQLADAEEVKGEIVTAARIRLITRLRTERAEAILAVRAALSRLRDQVPA